MKALRYVPLFLFVLLAYDAMVLLSGNPKGLVDTPLHAFHLVSGASWGPTIGDVFSMIGVVALFFELVKATDTSATAALDHILSVLVFVVFLVEFLVLPAAATSTFVLLMLMSLLDVVAGFTISVASARRDLTVENSSLH